MAGQALQALNQSLYLPTSDGGQGAKRAEKYAMS
jgi:hypothetical protein